VGPAAILVAGKVVAAYSTMLYSQVNKNIACTVPPMVVAAWCCHVACQGAANGNGGRGLPALAQAARATCRGSFLTKMGSFLTKIFVGGLF
jgi:hypothetical protein